MGENVNALKALYVGFGGDLTDTYETIKDGAPVSDYTTISEVIYALAALAPSVAIARA